MTEQESENWEEFFRNKLKSVDVDTLEQSIAKAVGDLIGVQFKCSINNVRYAGRDDTEFNVSLSERRNLDFGSDKSQELPQ